jgi:hypothetical protein
VGSQALALLRHLDTACTPGDLPVHSFATLLADLAAICLNTIAPADPALVGFRLVTTPTTLQRQASDLLTISYRLGVACQHPGPVHPESPGKRPNARITPGNFGLSLSVLVGSAVQCVTPPCQPIS